MDLLTVVRDVAIFAVASGLLTWLIKKLVDQSLKRDLEKFKAELAQTHAAQMQEAKNRFTIGATSHMAGVAFDKHVQFCEEYTKRVNTALDTLFRKGPNEQVLENANALVDTRREWTIWLTPEVESKLMQFEGALRKIGANGWLLTQLEAGDDRTETIKEAFGTFAAVMGWEKWKGEAVSQELASERVIEGLRNVLGISELTYLRAELVKNAVSNLAVSD
jgi:hypothetical protein